MCLLFLPCFAVEQSWNLRITADYNQFFELFDPDLFEPKDWAKRARAAVMRQEYPGWGGAMFTEPALKAGLPGGIRNTVPKYQGYEILCREKENNHA